MSRFYAIPESARHLTTGYDLMLKGIFLI